MKLLRSLLLLAGLASLAACAGTQPPAAEAPAPVTAPAPASVAAAPQTRTFTVYFDSGRADIRASAMQTIYAAWQTAQAIGPSRITVTGYADSAGRKSANQALSEHRAKAVAGQFGKLGLTVAMGISGKGEAAGTRRATDRRVDIVLEGGGVAAADARFAPSLALTDLPAGLNAASADQPDATVAATPVMVVVAPRSVAPVEPVLSSAAPTRAPPAHLMNVTAAT